MLPDIIKNTQDSLNSDSYAKSLSLKETIWGYSFRVNYHRKFTCTQPRKLGVGVPSQVFVIKSNYHQKRDKERIEDFMSMKDSRRSGHFDVNSTHKTFDTSIFSESGPKYVSVRFHLPIQPACIPEPITWHGVQPIPSLRSHSASCETIPKHWETSLVTSCSIQRGKKVATLADATACKKSEKTPEQVHKKKNNVMLYLTTPPKNKWFKLGKTTTYPDRSTVSPPVSHSCVADKESESGNCKGCDRPYSIPMVHVWRTTHKYNTDIILPEDVELLPVQDKPLYRYSADTILPEDVELCPVQEEHNPTAVNRGCQAAITTAIKLTRTLGNQTSRITRHIPKIRCHNYDPICYQADVGCIATQDDGILYRCGRCQMYTCRKEECVSQHHKVCKNRDFDVVRFPFHPSTG